MKDNEEKTAEVLAQEIIGQIEKTNKIVAKINSPSKAIAVNKYMYYILNTDEVSALYTNIKSILKKDEDINKVVTVDYKLGLYILKSGKFRLTFKGIDYTAKEARSRCRDCRGEHCSPAPLAAVRECIPCRRRGAFYMRPPRSPL